MATKDHTSDQLLDEVVRLLALQARFLFPSQAEAAVALHKAGFGNSRIAELLGTTSATVAKDVQRARGKRPSRGR
jgi:DNA-directed RNA polymerase specialized sigma24 family protein